MNWQEAVFTIPGEPVPWTPTKRNRRSGNRFLPARQEEAIARGVATIREEAERGAWTPCSPAQPFLLSATFVVKRPQSHYGTGRNAGWIKERFIDAEPIGRPDLTNLIKLAEDCLVLSEFLPDDDQIVGLYLPLQKRFAMYREQPYTRIRIKPL